MKIELDVSEENESTAEPWWMIVDPGQNFVTDLQGAANVAMGMITGPFFSREEAETVLKRTRYNYGKGAVVWCASGCHTIQYCNAYREARKKKEQADK